MEGPTASTNGRPDQRLKSWLRDHQVYVQDLKSLSNETVKAMQRYIASLEQFGKSGHEDLTRHLEENFDYRNYGIQDGPFFELDDLDRFYKIKMPFPRDIFDTGRQEQVPRF